MLILSRVCADFHDRNGNTVFRIGRNDLGLFIDAPEAIRQDLLFRMLVDDGSIRMPEDAAARRKLENDPMAGANAEGRETTVAGGDIASDTLASGDKAAKPRAGKAKTETRPAADENPKEEKK